MAIVELWDHVVLLIIEAPNKRQRSLIFFRHFWLPGRAARFCAALTQMATNMAVARLAWDPSELSEVTHLKMTRFPALVTIVLMCLFTLRGTVAQDHDITSQIPLQLWHLGVNTWAPKVHKTMAEKTPKEPKMPVCYMCLGSR